MRHGVLRRSDLAVMGCAPPSGAVALGDEWFADPAHWEALHGRLTEETRFYTPPTARWPPASRWRPPGCASGCPPGGWSPRSFGRPSGWRRAGCTGPRPRCPRS